MKRFISLGIFALITISAPLAFGAVDRSFQILLTALLAAGVFLTPPDLPIVEKRALQFAGALALILVGKEFLPYQLFGPVHWRSVLGGELGLPLPWSHHPEPARALDGMLVALVAVIWLVWVRGLASSHENRLIIAWVLFLSAAILATTCLVMPKGSLIYGIRTVPGWMGFGPFPNRNHTANFLAMGMLIGLGCCIHAARRKWFFTFLAGLLLLGVTFFSLIQSRSRGGLISCAIGLVFYALLALAWGRNRKTFALVGATSLAAFGVFMAFGAGLLARFSARGDLPTNLRWGIWHDAATMWKDAPLFGHGIGSFAQIFPIYQTVPLESQVVLHPESSWWQWLDEFGLIPVAALALFLFWFLGKHLKEAFAKKHGFLPQAALFAAVLTMIAHCFWDVPAHRWATAGFALATLALACPLNNSNVRPSGKWLAAIPIGVCLFWAWPLGFSGPSFSPTTLAKLLERLEFTPASVLSREIQSEADLFALTPELHQALGIRWLNSAKDSEKAWKQFQIADLLRPASWSLPASQGMASQRVSPGMSLHFWTLAIERAGHRKAEVFVMAYRRTITLPMAESFWARYAETNPELLLTYARMLSDKEARFYYAQWVKARSGTDQLGEEELANFYSFAARFGDLGQFTQWMEQHPSREKADYLTWAELLHGWGDDLTAWRLLSTYVKDPVWPEATLSTRKEILEANWLKDPASAVNAQALADAYQRSGEKEACKQVILTSANQKDAPTWFLQKAAFIYAAENHPDQAVACILKIPRK